MSIFEALVLGLVQGLTEFIPVSSSGHLILAHEIFGTSDNSLSFDVALHVGTLIALLIYFRKDIWSLAKNYLSNNSEGCLARLLIYATIPAALAGFFLGDFVDENLRTSSVVVFTLASVGVIMLLADRQKNKPSKSPISTKQGMLVGFAQVAALIPGVSRSGATITAGILVGLDRVKAARFSFLLAIPIISGSAFGIFLKDGPYGESGMVIIVGIISALLSGLFAIKFLLGVIAKVGLKPFAYYRIVLAVAVFIFLV